ncbi:MAG: hypothetical protein AAB131_00005, partial [Actinomycetota bacterium]
MAGGGMVTWTFVIASCSSCRFAASRRSLSVRRRFLAGVRRLAVLAACVVATSACGRLGYDGHPSDGPGIVDSGDADGAASFAIVQIAAGGGIDVAVADLGHSCALRANGEVLCWGDNGTGQLGDGTRNDSAVPIVVQGLTDAVNIDAGDEHTCAVRSSGAAACWGRNFYGELGIGDVALMAYVPLPTALVGVTDANQIAAGGMHGCLRRDDRTAACWGRNLYGELGDGTTTAKTSPVAVIGLTDVLNLDATSWECLGVCEPPTGHSCAVSADGTIACWGRNSYGQLGNGSFAPDQASPGPVMGVLDAVEVATSGWTTCARHAGGTVSCWGNSVPTPTPVPGISDAVQVVVGQAHRCARHSGGTVSCWGYNNASQLGDGTILNR